MNWLTTQQVLEKYEISETNLIAAVRTGDLIAYSEHEDYKPIDWGKLKEQFNEIRELGEKEYNDGKGSIVLERICSDDRSRCTVVEEVLTTEDIPWDSVYKDLARGNQVRISAKQYFAVANGWGGKQVKYYLQEAVFKQEDIESIFPKEAIAEEDKISMESLLKCIGAFLEIHYNGYTYRNDNGEPKYSPIYTSFSQQLAKAGLNNNGIGESSLRKKIFPLSFNQIKKNKTSSN